MSAAPKIVPAGPTIPSAVVEGIFLKAFKPEGAFLAELKAAGLDLTRLEPTYPLASVERWLDITCRHRFPGLAREEGYWRIGNEGISGFFETLLGKVVGATLNVVGPARFVDKIARPLAGLRGEVSIKVEVTGERSRVLHVRDPHPFPEVFAGAMHYVVGRAGGQSPRAQVVARTPTSFSIALSW